MWRRFLLPITALRGRSVGRELGAPVSGYYSVLYSAVLLTVIGLADLAMGNVGGGVAFLAFASLLFAMRWRLVRKHR